MSWRSVAEIKLEIDALELKLKQLKYELMIAKDRESSAAWSAAASSAPRHREWPPRDVEPVESKSFVDIFTGFFTNSNNNNNNNNTSSSSSMSGSRRSAAMRVVSLALVRIDNAQYDMSVLVTALIARARAANLLLEVISVAGDAPPRTLSRCDTLVLCGVAPGNALLTDATRDMASRWLAANAAVPTTALVVLAGHPHWLPVPGSAEFQFLPPDVVLTGVLSVYNEPMIAANCDAAVAAIVTKVSGHLDGAPTPVPSALSFYSAPPVLTVHPVMTPIVQPAAVVVPVRVLSVRVVPLDSVVMDISAVWERLEAECNVKIDRSGATAVADLTVFVFHRSTRDDPYGCLQALKDKASIMPWPLPAFEPSQFPQEALETSVSDECVMRVDERRLLLAIGVISRWVRVAGVPVWRIETTEAHGGVNASRLHVPAQVKGAIDSKVHQS